MSASVAGARFLLIARSSARLVTRVAVISMLPQTANHRAKVSLARQERLHYNYTCTHIVDVTSKVLNGRGAQRAIGPGSIEPYCRMIALGSSSRVTHVLGQPGAIRPG